MHTKDVHLTEQLRSEQIQNMHAQVLINEGLSLFRRDDTQQAIRTYSLNVHLELSRRKHKLPMPH